MKLRKGILIGFMVAAFAMAGCGDDGGGGGANDPNVICDVGICLTSNVAKADCVNAVNTCLALPNEAQRDECIGAALLENCNVSQ